MRTADNIIAMMNVINPKKFTIRFGITSCKTPCIRLQIMSLLNILEKFQIFFLLGSKKRCSGGIIFTECH